MNPEHRTTVRLYRPRETCGDATRHNATNSPTKAGTTKSMLD